MDTSRVSTSQYPLADPIRSTDSFAHTLFEMRALVCGCYRCAACWLVTGALSWLGSGTSLCQRVVMQCEKIGNKDNKRERKFFLLILKR
jgi:hypothetical protein